MGSGPLPRKLAAVLYADVAGYSRLTGRDEDGTHRQLSASLDLISSTVRGYRGRVVHYAGDAVLVDFDTASDALICAAAIQQALSERNAALETDRRIRFRIGINLGEVIVDRNDLYGDGVNVAARLEALADPGGICVSESVRSAVGNKLPLTFEFMGEQRVKNIVEPVRAYRTLLEPGAHLQPPMGLSPVAARRKRRLFIAAVVLVLVTVAGLVWWQPWAPVEMPAPPVQPTFPLPNKPSVAVLPFDNLSGDPAQEYFADGMTDDLITDLSRISELFVIARNSSFAYKGKMTDARQVSRELGVRYVLEGSVRRDGDQIRINAQLIDATTGGHVWAERYDGLLTNVFRLQDEVTRKIVAALAVNLTDDDRRLMINPGTSSTTAYEEFLRGWDHYRRDIPDQYAKAVERFDKALSLDPEFGRAHAALAAIYFRSWREGWHQFLGLQGFEAWNRTKAHLGKAMGEPTALSHRVSAELNLYLGRHEEAIADAEQAVSADPNDPDSFAILSMTLIFDGKPEQAMDALATARRHDPNREWYYSFVQGLAEFGADRFQDAAASFEKAIELNPELWSHAAGCGCNPLSALFATYGHLGRQQSVEKLRGKIFGNTGIDIDSVLSWWPYKQDRDKERLAEGLRKARLTI